MIDRRAIVYPVVGCRVAERQPALRLPTQVIVTRRMVRSTSRTRKLCLLYDLATVGEPTRATDP